MGAILSLQTITREQIPFWFSDSDSKSLTYQLRLLEYSDGELARLLDHLKLELPSLKRLVHGDDEPLENFYPDMSRKEIKRREQIVNAEREAAWLRPTEVIRDLSLLLNAIDNKTNSFSEVNISDVYFTSGAFRQDIEDLLKMAEWVQNKGIRKVRLLIRY